MAIHKCSQTGCNVEKDGKCLEGFDDYSSCPFYLAPEVNEVSVEEREQEQDEILLSEDFISVHQGEALDIVEVQEIASHSLVRLVVLAGRAEAGKTTTLASLFQLFQQNPSFAGYEFAGSQSLIGFEKRCHKSRMASGGNKEDTERTKLKPSEESHDFLHLKLRNADFKFADILFTDISGEYFNLLSDSTEESRKFLLMKRCDHFVLFFDSDLLSNDSEKNAFKISTLNILRSLIEAETLLPNTNIQIIFSRWDLLLSKPDVEKHIEFVQSIKNEIHKRFSETHPNIAFFELASRPDETSSLPFGHGINNLLPIWAEKSVFLKTNNDIEISKIDSEKTSRNFSKFKHS